MPTTRASPPPPVATQIRSCASTANAYTVLAGSVLESCGSCRKTLTTVPSARARSKPPPSVPIHRLPLLSSAIALTLAALIAPGAAAPKGNWRMSPVVGSTTFAPPPCVPTQIWPLRVSKIVMMPAALSPCGSPGFTGMDSSCPVGPSFLTPLARVPIHSVPR